MSTTIHAILTVRDFISFEEKNLFEKKLYNTRLSGFLSRYCAMETVREDLNPENHLMLGVYLISFYVEYGSYKTQQKAIIENIKNLIISSGKNCQLFVTGVFDKKYSEVAL